MPYELVVGLAAYHEATVTVYLFSHLASQANNNVFVPNKMALDELFHRFSALLLGTV